MNILMISSESVPFSKSGGLADVIGALTPRLTDKAQDARIILPSYNTEPEDSGVLVCSFKVPMLGVDHDVEIRLRSVGKVPYYFICNPIFNSRKGIYGDTSFEPYPDNLSRFALMCKSALMFCRHTGWKPDVINCHDWTSGLVPYMIKTGGDPFFKDTKTVFTIHNLAYQGVFARMDFLSCNIKPDDRLFSNGQINLMQSGIMFSDYITTVSPTYAKEIQTQEYGCGFENILSGKKAILSGIVNGIDTNEWNSETDSLIDYHFSKEDFSGKAKLKEQLQKTFGLAVKPDTPVVAMISRMASQKGFDALSQALEPMARSMDIQFLIIGTGDRKIEEKLTEIAQRNDNVSVNILFSNKAAHLAEAGSDFFLMPSRYEPCGLNQLYSLRYGTLPIARRTGGLADTVSDIGEDPQNGTGLLFDDLTPSEITRTVKRALELYRDGTYRQMRVNAMSRDFSWGASADKYISIYRKITSKE